jgi:hypothetical protein
MIDIADERAIIAVLLRYATGIDRRDWPLFRTCFTTGFEGHYPGFGDWHGADVITEFMQSAHAGLGPTLHRMTNFVIDGDTQNASASSYVDAFLMPLSADGDVHRAAGWYEDAFVRGRNGWQIARRRFVPVHIT